MKIPIEKIPINESLRKIKGGTIETELMLCDRINELIEHINAIEAKLFTTKDLEELK